MNQKIVAKSLLSLNEYCLLEIFKFLQLSDSLNLVKSYKQLKLICARTWAQKCKRIEVQVYKNKGMNKKEFLNALSVIGENIVSVSVTEANQLILQFIADNCKNMKRIELWSFNGPIELQCFENLKELKLTAVTMSTNELKSCFEKNAELESLEYACSYGEDFLELLDMLPKLKSLHLHNVRHSLHLNQHLHCLDGLTKFSFYSPDNCNQLLMKLTENSTLKELQLRMPSDIDTFNIIKSFQSLEVFTMHNFYNSLSLPESMVFPRTLKSVKVTGVKITSETFSNLDESLDFNDKTIITQIEVKLTADLERRQRPLIIMYHDWAAGKYIHRSPKLHIINSCATHNPTKLQSITVRLPL